jgi:hypothetical protein
MPGVESGDMPEWLFFCDRTSTNVITKSSNLRMRSSCNCSLMSSPGVRRVSGGRCIVIFWLRSKRSCGFDVYDAMVSNQSRVNILLSPCCHREYQQRRNSNRQNNNAHSICHSYLNPAGYSSFLINGNSMIVLVSEVCKTNWWSGFGRYLKNPIILLRNSL